MGNRCEELGFSHCWEDTTPNVMYPTYPPQFPSPERTCKNCKRIERLKVIQRQIEEWEEIK